MAVRFIIGRAGTGKTRRIFDAIVDRCAADPLGRPVYWLLPKQATFMAERALTCRSGLGAVSRCRVVSFDELGRDVLNECGGVAIPEITPAGRRMLLGFLLRKHKDELGFFASTARQAGLASELDRAFEEFDRAGRSPAELAALAEDLDATVAPDQSLYAKLKDLAHLYDAYLDYLGQDRLDPHRRLEQVLERLANCSGLKGAHVFVDGFLEFSESERRILASLAQVADTMEIALLLDPRSPAFQDVHHKPDELSLFHRTETAYQRLWFTFNELNVAMDEPVLLTHTKRFGNPHLRHLEQAFGQRRPPRIHSHGGVELIEACDRRAEVDAAARQVKSLLREGLRLRDIAVLVRDLETYHELVDASFKEHEIPHFVDRRRKAIHHPLLQLTRAAMLAGLHDWPHEAAMTLVKCGLCGLTQDQSDAIENVVLTHRIRGRTWESREPWRISQRVSRATDEDETPPEVVGEVDEVDTLRHKLADPLRPLLKLLRSAEPITVRQLVAALYRVYDGYGVRHTLADWMDRADSAGRPEERGEHEQVWAELMEVLDQLVELLGDETVTGADFLEILDSGLEQFDLALTPPTVDQVLVGNVERSRAPEARAVIVMGLAEGEFPRVAREDSVLSDDQRKALSGRGVPIDPDSQRALLDENLLGYLALTRASQHLCVTRPQADDGGRTLAPSAFWDRLLQIFPGIAPRSVPRDTSDRLDVAARLELVGTPRQLVKLLMRWARDFAAEPKADPNDPRPALYDWLARREAADDQIDTMRVMAWRALSYANDARLSKHLAAALFPTPLRASVSRIEAFASCPFKHFARYGLKLQERETDEVTALDLGTVYHGVLERVVGDVLAGRCDWPSMSVEQRQTLVKTLAKQVGRELRGEILLSSKRNEYLLARIEHTLDKVLAHQCAAGQRGHFRPAGAELVFGHGERLDPLTLETPSGKIVELRGKIDRIDVLEQEAAVAVIDYKLGGGRLQLDRVYHGISLQLLTYLLVLQANGEKLRGKPLTPAAAFYVRLLRSLEKVSHPSDATPPDDPAFELKEKPRGVLDRRYIDSLDYTLEGGRSEVFAIAINKGGELGSRNSTDTAEPDEFAALLRRVRCRIGELADHILLGEVTIEPYRLGDSSPCPHCPYRSVCRFDVAINRYHTLEPMRREDVLRKVVQEASDGA